MIQSTDIRDTIAVLGRRGLVILTSNDVWDEIGHDATLAHKNGTMGRGFTLAARGGLIEPTGRYIKASHAARKKGAVQQWRFTG